MSLDGSISNCIRTFSKDQLITTLISIFPFFSMTWLFFLFSEIFLFLWLIGNKTLFCWILSEIILVINKSDSHFAVVPFCYHSYHYSLNWTPLSPVTITCNCQHLTWGFLICLRTKAIWPDKTSTKKCSYARKGKESMWIWYFFQHDALKYIWCFKVHNYTSMSDFK